MIKNQFLSQNWVSIGLLCILLILIYFSLNHREGLENQPIESAPATTDGPATDNPQSAFYKVDIGNWTKYVQNVIQGKENANFIVGKSGGGTGDPAVGCEKQFATNYQCGNGPTKEANILDGEAGGRSVLFDCTKENAICKGFRLTLDDTGNLVLTDSQQKSVWQSNTNKVGKPVKAAMALKGVYKRNFLQSGEMLKIGEFIGSPTGNCMLMMTETGLQIQYYEPNCGSTGMGNDNNSGGVYSIGKPLSEAAVNGLGKTAYINTSGLSQEYPAEMVSYADTYSLLGNFTLSDPLASIISTKAGQNAQMFEEECNKNMDCAGILFNKTARTGILLNNKMFPASARIGQGDSELYTRNKRAKNSESCPKEFEDGSALQWENIPVGDKMTLDTQCKLGRITKDEQQDMKDQNAALSGLADDLQRKINNLSDEDVKIAADTGMNITKMKKDLDQYGQTNKQKQINTDINTNLGGMVEDADLVLVSQNYKYLLYSILAIIVIIAGVKMARST